MQFNGYHILPLENRPQVIDYAVVGDESLNWTWLGGNGGEDRRLQQ